VIDLSVSQIPVKLTAGAERKVSAELHVHKDGYYGPEHKLIGHNVGGCYDSRSRPLKDQAVAPFAKQNFVS
jgi:hypothetical protein